ncbi:FAD-dependent oxidoreductase [Rhodobacter capsulatus]|uniref:FAD-dependent oxidoreductase n=1 Tax=Rhodobacter capsulatus TaxID=1061 RepID=UPI0040283F42
MTRLTRRHLALGLFATSAVAAAGGIGLALAPSDRAVIVGAGPAGAQAALALRAAHPALRVTLLERDPTRLARETGDAAAAAFVPPRTEATLSRLKAQGIEVMLDDVTDVDWTAGRLSLFSGRDAAFDRLYLAPGTTAKAEAIEGLDAEARFAMPAAWGNAREARRLAAQLAALPEAGHVVLRLPAEPEPSAGGAAPCAGVGTPDRRHPPAARLTVLDATPTPALAQSFAMAKRLQGIDAQVAWITAAEGAGVTAVDARAGRIETGAGSLRADVINFVPPHVAGAIARTAGLVDASGWCPCDARGRSMLRSDAVVLGDARKGTARTLDGARLSVAATVAQA